MIDRRGWMGQMVAALALVPVLGLAACGDSTPDYRYQLKVEVDTPEGVKTGTSVIEVQQSMGRTAMSGGGKRIDFRIRGEAVAVDLPGGRTLFALLRSDNDVEWAARVMLRASPRYAGESWEQRFDDMQGLRGEQTIPRRWPHERGRKDSSAYPMLVTFGDVADPASVALVDPDNLAASFGEGYALKRISVMLTDDPVTEGIEERLGWLGDTEGSIGLTPMEARRAGVDPNGLSSQLVEVDFCIGLECE